MKLAYSKESSRRLHLFTFILDDYEVSDPLSDRAYPHDAMNAFMYAPGLHDENRIGFALGIIKEAYLKGNKEKDMDLGLNYKEKYKEMEALLEPYKIDNMDLITTLKMLLKYEIN
jgi:hypothetical protein